MQDKLAQIIYTTERYEDLTPVAQEVVTGVIKWHYKELEHNVSEAYKQGYTQGAIPFITGEVERV